MFGRAIGMNCLSAFLKILKLPKWNKGNFKILKNNNGDLSQKSPKPNMFLLINHTNPKNSLYWN